MKNAEQFQILTNHCKMADSRVEPEGEGGNIDEVWEGREISGIVWTKMMAIVMMMNITAVRVMMVFQRILEGRRACLSTGGSETTCPNDSKSCQFTVNIMNSQWISSTCVKKKLFHNSWFSKKSQKASCSFLKVRIGTRNYIFTPGHGDMDELRVSNTYFSNSKSMSHKHHLLRIRELTMNILKGYFTRMWRICWGRLHWQVPWTTIKHVKTKFYLLKNVSYVWTNPSHLKYYRDFEKDLWYITLFAKDIPLLILDLNWLLIGRRGD